MSSALFSFIRVSRALRNHHVRGVTLTANASGNPWAANRERGAGRLKAILWTMVLAAFVYTGVLVVPLYVRDYTFEDGIQTIARFATVNRHTPEQIRAAVMAEAQKDGIPVAAKDIQIKAVNGNVQISAAYSVTVDLHLYRWTLNFHPSVSNNAL